jgi:DNA-binding NtrC family response regulator
VTGTEEKAQKQFGHFRVFVVDDEAIVRDVARQLFERLGAIATVATGAVDAVRQLASATQPFDVAVVDVTLIDGRCEDLLGEIVQAMPRCHLVAMSGYDVSRAPLIPGHRVRFLQKPFTLDSMRRLLAEMSPGQDADSLA